MSEEKSENPKITMDEALIATEKLRMRLGSITGWFPVRRGQLLKCKEHYNGKKPGDLILVIKDSANHEIFVDEDGDKRYEKYHGHKKNFTVASESEIQKYFGEGVKAKSAEEVTNPNSDKDLTDLDNDIENPDETGGEDTSGQSGGEEVTNPNSEENSDDAGGNSSETGGQEQ